MDAGGGDSAAVTARARFLAALHASATVPVAAAAAGTTAARLYRARRGDRDFAAAWDAARAAPAIQTQWGPQLRRRFIAALAQTGSPAQAAAHVGRTLAGAYALRQRSARFAADWVAAQERTLDQLEAAMASRALAVAPGFDGVQRTLARGRAAAPDAAGDRLAMFLLKALRPEKFDRRRGVAAPPPAPRYDREQLVARLREVSRRVAREDGFLPGGGH